jgi:methionine biosynthesis protein MetW
MNTPENNNLSVSARYSYDIDMSGGTAAAEVIRMTGHGKRVLELGPGPGTILRYLATHQDCKVSAVELDQECVDELKSVCEIIIQGDLDHQEWLKTLEGQHFDVIIAADVLEHLKNPWQCLMNVRNLLAPGGYAVISIPNVGHHSVLASLISGRFPYQSRGLLDRTHLRFFTRYDFENILYETGFLPSHWFAVQKLATDAELGHHWVTLQANQQDLLTANPYGNDYQYVVRAFASDEAGSIAKARMITDEVQAESLRQQQEILRQQQENLRLQNLLLLRQEALEAADQKIADQVILFSKQDQHYQQISTELQTRLDAVHQQQQVLLQNLESSQQQAASLATQLQNANMKIEELWTSTSWRITRPVRGIKKLFSGVPLRLLLRNTYRTLPDPFKSALDKTGITGSVRNSVADTIVNNHKGMINNAALSPLFNPFKELGIAVSKQNSEDVIFWGVIDWHFRFQRPQQLASGFHQRGHRVFYVSSELVNHSEPGYQLEPISGLNNVFQIRFYADSAPPIYEHKAHGALLRQLQLGFAKLLRDAQITNSISIVQHPFWLPMARSAPDSRFVYDCMDHHEGFGNCPPDVIAGERALMREADTLIVTSDWLYAVAHNKNPNTYIVRNACEFRHFNQVPTTVYRDPKQRKILGYFGAIADWFDCSIVEALAQHFPDCLILLVGNDTCGARKKFAKYKNINMIGEVSYGKLPHYLHAFDACILPFKIMDLTLATNPVKIYEYMCAGKPIVSVQLPELASMKDFVYLADDKAHFIKHCETALQEPADAETRSKRIAYASEQTWIHRAEELEDALESSTLPFVSIVVVTYNNLDLTKLCLASIDAETRNVRYEIIIVDNASSDGSPQYLQEFANGRDDVVLILNQDNTGFSKANNQGLAQAKGDYLVVLNNDTVVTSGWATGLIRHCKKDPTIGLIGPVTNNIGNEAKIEIQYDSLQEMPAKARDYTLRHLGQSFDIRTLAFFCVMITRQTYDRIGGLDEAFGLGFFEDDDYCRRVDEAKLRIVCADDVFVHHNLSASFNKLGQERKQELFQKNKAIYEAKWGKWVPHSYRI